MSRPLYQRTKLIAATCAQAMLGLTTPGLVVAYSLVVSLFFTGIVFGFGAVEVRIEANVRLVRTRRDDDPSRTPADPPLFPAVSLDRRWRRFGVVRGSNVL